MYAYMRVFVCVTERDFTNCELFFLLLVKSVNYCFVFSFNFFFVLLSAETELEVFVSHFRFTTFFATFYCNGRVSV